MSKSLEELTNLSKVTQLIINTNYHYFELVIIRTGIQSQVPGSKAILLTLVPGMIFALNTCLVNKEGREQVYSLNVLLCTIHMDMEI